MRPHPEFCFSCTEGRYREHIIADWQAPTLNGKILSVTDLSVLVCDKCGDKIVPRESSRRIEEALYEGNATRLWGIRDRFHPHINGDKSPEIRSDNKAFASQIDFFAWCRQHGALDEVYEVFPK